MFQCTIVVLRSKLLEFAVYAKKQFVQICTKMQISGNCFERKILHLAIERTFERTT